MYYISIVSKRDDTMCTMTEDAKVFGEGKFVYCESHVNVHSTGWCTVPVREKRALWATTHEEAVAEARALGLPIYGEK